MGSLLSQVPSLPLPPPGVSPKELPREAPLREADAPAAEVRNQSDAGVAALLGLPRQPWSRGSFKICSNSVAPHSSEPILTTSFLYDAGSKTEVAKVAVVCQVR